MIFTEGDRLFIRGQVVSTRTNPQGITIKVRGEDAKQLRSMLDPTFKDVEAKYKPGWMKNKTNVLFFKSQYDVPCYIGDLQFASIENVQAFYGGCVLRNSYVKVAISVKVSGGKGGVYLKSITFEKAVTTTLNNFFDKEGESV